MWKIFVSIFLYMIVTFLSAHMSFAAESYATCDLCGICPSVVNGVSPKCEVTKPDPLDSTKVINLFPGDWRACLKCVYEINAPTTQAQPNCDTLTLITDPAKPAEPPVLKIKPIVGRQYTMLGCIKAGTDVGFTDQKGAPSFVQALLNVIFSLVGGIAFLYLMYGGFTILTSQADPEKLNYGRRLIYGAIAGLIITLGSVFLVNLIGSGILRIPGFTPQ